MKETFERRARIADMNNRATTLFLEGDMAMAEAIFSSAAAIMTPEEDDLAALVYENIGLARFNQRRFRSAARAFLRALDGKPASRPQSAAFIVRAFAGYSAWEDAKTWLTLHERYFGPHPHGVTTEGIEATARASRAKPTEQTFGK